MKYLKLFEKQDIDSYYVQITNSEFDNKVREADIGDQGYKAGYIGDHWEEFTNREYDEISSLVNNIPDIEYLSNSGGIKIKIHQDKKKSLLTILGYDQKNISEPSKGKYKISISIFKLESEWFYIYVYFCGKFLDFPHNGMYFKCDQLVGLLKFLQIEIPKVISK